MGDSIIRTNELKPCPFCGGDPRLRKHNRTIIKGKTERNCYVYCQDCDARAERFVYQDFAEPRYFHEKAIKAWNKRQMEDDIVEKLEETKKQNEALRNRCKAITGGALCLFCPMECEHRTMVFRGEQNKEE